MRAGDVLTDWEILRRALLFFSVTSLGTLEFIKNGFPVAWLFQLSKTGVVCIIIIVQVIPALALLAVDRLIAARDKSGKVLTAYRAAVFTLGFVLILRQVQLYWDPAGDFATEVRYQGTVFLVLMDLAILVALAAVSLRLQEAVVSFFYYMAPIAVAMTAILPFQVPTQDDIPGYANEVTTANGGSESKPAVFVLIMDEMAYDTLADGDQPDAERYPNLAALADDGAWFTNATTNYIWSTQAVPLVVDGATGLTDEFDVRLYLQFQQTEEQYISDCGKLYTCRGVHYVTHNNELWLGFNIALRSFYKGAPEALETAVKAPVKSLVNRLGTPYPPADPALAHMLSKKQFDVFLDDIHGPESLGRIHVLHSMLSHPPAVFDENGNTLTTGYMSRGGGPYFEKSYEKYADQLVYVDEQVGRLVDRLKKQGIYDNSVIAITADHGLRRVTPSGDEPINVDGLMVRVPLLIRAPGLDSQIADVDYQHIDFAATLADVLRLQSPAGSRGVSAFAEERPEREKTFEVTKGFRLEDLKEDHWTYLYNAQDDSWNLTGVSSAGGGAEQ